MKVDSNIRLESKQFRHLPLFTDSYHNKENSYPFVQSSRESTSNTKNEIKSYHARSNSKVYSYDNNFIYSQVTNKVSENENHIFIEKVNTTEKCRNENEIAMMRKEIDCLKEMLESSYKIKTLKSGIKEEIMKETNSLIDEHRSQTANSLRQAIIKINENMKKECMTVLHRNYLPISFIEKSSSDFEDVLKRLSSLEKLNSYCEVQKEIKMFHEEMNKSTEQIEMLGRNLKSLEISLFQKTAKEKEQESNSIKMFSKIEKLENFTNNFESQVKKEIHCLFENLQFFKNEQKLCFDNKINEFEAIMNKYRTNSPQNCFSSKKDQNFIDQNCNSFKSADPESLGIPSKEMSLTFSLESLSDTCSLKKQYPSESSSLKDIKSIKYIIDINNNLTDDQGNYILNSEGEQIMLTNEQILQLQYSNIVKFNDY